MRIRANALIGTNCAVLAQSESFRRTCHSLLGESDNQNFRPSVEKIIRILADEAIALNEAHSSILIQDGVKWEIVVIPLPQRQIMLLAGVYSEDSERNRQLVAQQTLCALADKVPASIIHLDGENRVVYSNRYASKINAAIDQKLFDAALLASIKIKSPEYTEVKSFSYIDHILGISAKISVEKSVSEIDATCETYILTQLLNRREADDANVGKHFDTLADNLPVLISYIDCDLRYQYCNATFGQWLNLDPKSLAGRPVQDVLGATHFAQRKSQLLSALQGEAICFDVMVDIPGKDDRELQTSYIPHRDRDGRIIGLYTVSADVTQFKAQERRLADLASTDPMTGLSNRRHFDIRLSEGVARAKRSKAPLAVIYIDIDNFKAVNDAFGHQIGDEIIIQTASRIRKCVRSTDTVARLGGDEFAIILEDDGSPEVTAQRILQAAFPTFLAGDVKLQVGISIGYAFDHGVDLQGEAIVERADKALYNAKRSGRNQAMGG